MTKITPLIAVNNSFRDNWKLRKSTIKFVKAKGFEQIVALTNAKRIEEIKVEDRETLDTVKGLEAGMKALGFDTTLDVSNNVDREFMAPSGIEREDW